MTCLTFRQITRSKITHSMLSKKPVFQVKQKHNDQKKKIPESLNLSSHLIFRSKLAGVCGWMKCYIEWPLEHNINRKSKFLDRNDGGILYAYVCVAVGVLCSRWRQFEHTANKYTHPHQIPCKLYDIITVGFVNQTVSQLIHLIHFPLSNPS